MILAKCVLQKASVLFKSENKLWSYSDFSAIKNAVYLNISILIAFIIIDTLYNL